MLEGKNLFALIGGALAIVGSVLPWMSISALGTSESILGIKDIAGILALLVGVLAVVLQFVKQPWGGIATLSSSALILLFVFVKFVLKLGLGAEIQMIQAFGGSVSTGFGCWISLIGLGVAAFGGFQEFQKSRQA